MKVTMTVTSTAMMTLSVLMTSANDNESYNVGDCHNDDDHERFNDSSK